MLIKVFEDRAALAPVAAAHAASAICRAIDAKGTARVVAACAASQFEFLEVLVRHSEIDWNKVVLFHLDEYLGVPMTHPVSFCKFLQDHLVSQTGIGQVHLLDGMGDPAEVLRLANEAISAAPIDIAFLGIGENGHLAFNDPPADFETEQPFLVVALDQACRQQQVNEGWFEKLEDVPTQALSMSVRQILKARELLAVVPGHRKAEAIAACFGGEITPLAPASILRTHADATVYLDRMSAALLDPARLAAFSPSAG
jgi:glucosamine-6-phosphate deaminase